MPTIRILVVEDEVSIRDMIKFALTPNGYEITEANHAKEALKMMALQKPDLILLDWMLPGLSGIDFVTQLKKNVETQNIPIIMLTARAEEENKVKGLEQGADDYITKPFSPRELSARIKTVLRRGTLVNPEGIIQVGKITLDTNTHLVTIENKTLTLTTNEYKLLLFFVKNTDKTFSREQLLNSIWGHTLEINERSVDVQVQRLRSRLEPYQCDHYIKTIRGFGYQFQVSNA